MRRQNLLMMTLIRQINALHCASAGLYLSSICNKMAFFFHENKKFGIVKKKDPAEQLFNEQ